MEKVFTNERKNLYRTTLLKRFELPVISLVFLLLIDLLVFGMKHTPENLKWLSYLGSSLFVVCALVGLYSESLELNFFTKNLHYQSSWAGIKFREAMLDFDTIRSLQLAGSSFYNPTTGGTYTLWFLLLIVEGNVPAKLLLEFFAMDKNRATFEAEELARKLAIRIEFITK